LVDLTIGLMFATSAGFTVGQSSIHTLLFAVVGVDELPLLYLLLGALLFPCLAGVTSLLGGAAATSLIRGQRRDRGAPDARPLGLGPSRVR
jgi:hypothetical protein